MQILCMSAVYRGRPNNTPIRGKHPTPLQSHIVKQTNTTNPQNTPQHSQQCSGCTYYAISRKTLCYCGCVRVCVRMNGVNVNVAFVVKQCGMFETVRRNVQLLTFPSPSDVSPPGWRDRKSATTFCFPARYWTWNRYGCSARNHLVTRA